MRAKVKIGVQTTTMATIRDVARASGVSVTTVSVVLNDSPRPVNPETRRRVIATARQLNYHPNAIARGLVRRRTNSLGVLFNDIDPALVTNSYAAGVLEGIFREGARREYDIHLFTALWVSAEVSAARIRAQRTDGTLLIAPPIGSDMAAGLAEVGHPVVVVSAPCDVPGVPFVDVDNAAGARIAAEHLLSLGHTRIAHLMGGLTQHSVHERHAAFKATLESAGVSLPPEYAPPGDFEEPRRTENARRLLTLPERPTAIFATNDNLAVAAVRVARELEISVPEELSIVGFDDYPVAEYSTPQITTIRHPLAEISARAVQLLIQRIEEEPVNETAHYFTPELIVRASTARVRR